MINMWKGMEFGLLLYFSQSPKGKVNSFNWKIKFKTQKYGMHNEVCVYAEIPLICLN
jgi:hypothetical protein